MLANHRYARLGRKGDRLPWGRRLFGKGTDHDGYEIVDLRDLTWALIRDGSIVLEQPPAAAPPLNVAAEPAAAAGERPAHEA